MNQRMVKILLFVLLAYLLTNCGGNAQENPQGEKEGNKADSTQTKEGKNKNGKDKEDSEDIPVEVASIIKGEISDFILLSSNLETEIQADVFAKAQGIVDSILTEEGRYVKKGQVMLKLEAKEYEISERKAWVEYQRQKSLYERKEAMFKKTLLSQEEFDQARYALEGAKLSWDEAALNLDYMSIRSPINGWVGERLTKIGARIQQSDKLFSVVNKTEVIAIVHVPEKNLNVLNIGQKAQITSENLKDEVFAARIIRISPVVDPASGTFKVTVGVNNRQNKLKPGMFINVHLIIDTHSEAVLIPKTAVVYENEYMNIFVVRDSVAKKIRLVPGFEDSEKIESLNDVKEGEKVIVVGQAGMKDDTRVRIVSEREISYKQ